MVAARGDERAQDRRLEDHAGVVVVERLGRRDEGDGREADVRSAAEGGWGVDE